MGLDDPVQAADQAWRDALRDAWGRSAHPGWLARTWPYPGNERMRVYLALILRGVDWGDPDWSLLEEQRLFYEPPVTPSGEEEPSAEDDSNPLPWWHDGFAGAVTGLALALGAGICLGWIHL